MKQFKNDVNHPQHYGGADDPYEAIKVINAWGLSFELGSVLKYICRAGKKPGEATVKDLQKAAWYLNHAIERMQLVETVEHVNGGIHDARDDEG